MHREQQIENIFNFSIVNYAAGERNTRNVWRVTRVSVLHRNCFTNDMNVITVSF